MGINKQGVISMNGNPNPNLLPNTTFNELQCTYPSSGYKDWWTQKTIIIPSASQYTLSFYAKSTVNGDKIRTHYYNPNTTTTGVSNQGTTTTSSDGHMNFTLSTDWQLYWVIYSQSETTSKKSIICPRLLNGQGTGIVSIKYIKLEKGNIPTTWIYDNTNTNYIDVGRFIEINDICKIQKQGYIQSPEFIEI